MSEAPLNIGNHGQRRRGTEKLFNSSSGGGIEHIVAHSLGGIVSEKLKQHNQEKNNEVTTYGCPVISMSNSTRTNITRYEHIGDPIASFDKTAKVIGAAINPFQVRSWCNS